MKKQFRLPGNGEWDVRKEYFDEVQRLSEQDKSARFKIAVDWIKFSLEEKLLYKDNYDRAYGLVATRTLLRKLLLGPSPPKEDARTSLRTLNRKIINMAIEKLDDELEGHEGAVELEEHEGAVMQLIEQAFFDVTDYAEALLEDVQAQPSDLPDDAQACRKVEHDNLMFGAHLAEYLDIQPHKGVVEYVRAVEAKEITPPEGTRAANPHAQDFIQDALEIGLVCGLTPTHNFATNNPLSCIAAILKAVDQCNSRKGFFVPQGFRETNIKEVYAKYHKGIKRRAEAVLQS